MGKKLLCWALFLIAASFIIPAIANKPTYCGTEDRYEVKVDNVRITPNPIVSGKSATFNISATSGYQETGVLGYCGDKYWYWYDKFSKIGDEGTWRRQITFLI
ncbi:uncharacterized protein LOC131876628 [Cryptomeria japonica]|uniref:uncharacterized protein LOC131876628 n=1 Tax=Cryptomeria japonica TaxID=3369 RepID=UPI0027DA48BE|nr:uncharacterized protein LOC131876628 [Cryptomeria japonica]